MHKLPFRSSFKGSCFENSVIFTKICPFESLLKEVTLCRVSISFERSAPPNIISEKFTKHSAWLAAQIWAAKCD